MVTKLFPFFVLLLAHLSDCQAPTLELNVHWLWLQDGRIRLVKGSGEIIERIVTKDEHKKINGAFIVPRRVLLYD